MKSKLHSYVVTDVSGITILHRFMARDLDHAAEKFNAFFSRSLGADRIMSYADYCADRDAALEPMGIAPWQKRLTKQTDFKTFGL